MLLIVAALAEMQYQRTSDRLTVIYLLDQSLSIPEARRDGDDPLRERVDPRAAQSGERATGPA